MTLLSALTDLSAFDGLSIAIEQGEIVGLIGPNGSGKTTLLNAISGVLRATSGTFSMEGTRWASLSPADAARIGIRRTFQNIQAL